MIIYFLLMMIGQKLGMGSLFTILCWTGIVFHIVGAILKGLVKAYES